VRRREQTFRREQYLEPREALRRLLRNSSFVREPTAVVRRAAMEREGLFDTTVGGATDTGMWNPDTIRANGEILDRAVARGVVPKRTIRRWEADWYHQFILAGAYRRLRRGGGPRPARCGGCSSCRTSPSWGVAQVAAGAGGVHGRQLPGPPPGRLTRRRLSPPAPATPPASRGRCRAGTGGGRPRCR
jgi:hypothetical protein